MEVSSIGIATAFAAGVVSFLSPCVLPLVPGYLGYLGSTTTTTTTTSTTPPPPSSPPSC